MSGFDLNPHQKEAVEAEGHCVISACPGSGKTRVLSERGARLLSVDSGRLCAVTFTRDAAQELRARIIQSSQGDVSRRVAAGTFHSLALNQLRRRNKSLRVLGGGEQRTLLRRAWERHAVEMTFEEAVEAVDLLRSSMAPLPPEGDSEAASILHAYLALLNNMKALDFAEILRESVRLMREGQLDPLSVRWMEVDEAQDMDEVQYAWVCAHADAGAEITIVGDDDQSIYGWRQAMGYEGMKRFERDYHARHICLPVNYRCAPEILQPAAELIARNTERIAKPIEAFRQPVGSHPETFPFADSLEEAEAVATHISEDRPEDWAVLARTNTQLDLIEARLAAAQVPYYRVGGGSVWDSEIAGALLGILGSVQADTPNGICQLMAWLEMPHDLLVESASQHPQNGIEAIDSLMSVLSARADASAQGYAPTLKSLRKVFPEWRQAVAHGREELAIRGAGNWMASRSDCASKGQRLLLSACQSALCSLQGSLASRMALVTRKKDAEKVGAALVTMHAAKGLEFPKVWIIGAEQGVIPHSSSPVDEERRLFYVAMTRAKDHLRISYSIAEENRPCQYIAEAFGTSAAA